MDVMELVENEPNARPFQCDWQTCNKVRTWEKRWTKKMDQLTVCVELQQEI